MVGRRTESAGVVGDHVAEGMPSGRRDFLRAGDGVAVPRGKQHALAVDPQRHAVVAPALERPRAEFRLLDVELPHGIRSRVVHVAERARPGTVVCEEQRLVVRNRAARGAARLFVEASDDAVGMGKVAVAEVARGEHRAAARGDIDRHGRALADVEAAEKRRRAFETRRKAVADCPLAADRTLHLLVADERRRAVQRHVAVASKRGVPCRRRAVRLVERPSVRVAGLEAGGDEVRNRPVGSGVHLAAPQDDLAVVRVVLIPRLEARAAVVEHAAVLDETCVIVSAERLVVFTKPYRRLIDVGHAGIHDELGVRPVVCHEEVDVCKIERAAVHRERHLDGLVGAGAVVAEGQLGGVEHRTLAHRDGSRRSLCLVGAAPADHGALGVDRGVLEHDVDRRRVLVCNAEHLAGDLRPGVGATLTNARDAGGQIAVHFDPARMLAAVENERTAGKADLSVDLAVVDGRACCMRERGAIRDGDRAVDGGRAGVAAHGVGAGISGNRHIAESCAVEDDVAVRKVDAVGDVVCSRPLDLHDAAVRDAERAKRDVGVHDTEGSRVLDRERLLRSVDGGSVAGEVGAGEAAADVKARRAANRGVVVQH